MKLSIGLVVASATMALALCGCDPDEVSVTMDVSDIVKAYNGEAAYAQAKIEYSTLGMDKDDEEDKAKLENCKRIAQKYVGKGGRVRITKGDFKDGISAELNIPIYNFANPQKFPHIPPLNMAISKDRTVLYILEESDVIAKLNAELSRATRDGDDVLGITKISAGFAGKTHFFIHNDTPEPFSFSVIGAFVNDEPVLSKSVCLKEGEECEIMFPRKEGEDHIYHKIWPRIFDLKIGSGKANPGAAEKVSK